MGKTTLAKDMKALILAFEDGTRAMSGAYRQIMQSWGDIKSIARYCKDPAFKKRYSAIAVDTIDIAASLCEKYICQQANVDTIGKIPYGGGWSKFKKEFEETFRIIANEGYAVLFISHYKEKTITKPDGTEYVKTVPSVSDTINSIVMNMSDIIGYAYQDDEDETKRWLVLRGGKDITAGTRFPYMASKIPFGYTELVKALNEAIDAEVANNGEDAVTDKKMDAIFMDIEYNYEELMDEFQEIVGTLMAKDQTYYAPRIKQITEHTLGKGMKVSEATIDQAELIFNINKEIKETLLAKAK